MLALLIGNLTPLMLQVAVVLLSAHGIYSLSFLELWSLTQGSYSLSILEKALVEPLTAQHESDIQELIEIGISKQQDRIIALQNLGLVKGYNNDFRLTSKGRKLASILSMIAWTANI
jgi:hypothetical protein